MEIMMKKILSAVLAFALISVFGESFEDELNRVETWINTTYQAGSLAHRSYSQKLLNIFNSRKTEEEKIADLRKTFPKAFPAVEKENLIVTEPITWEIGPLKLGYDIQEGTATEVKTGDIIKDLNQIEASHGKNKTKTTIDLETGGFGAEGKVTAQAGIKGSSSGGTGFNWGIGASGSISGRYEKNSTDRVENGVAWNKKNQRMFQRNRENIHSMIKQAAFKNLHLAITVRLYNRTNSNIYFNRTTASIPVYMGKQSCGAAKITGDNSQLVLRKNNPDGQVVYFRMELGTTSARELVDFMMENVPRIAFEQGNIEIVNSRGENILTKRDDLLSKSSRVVISGSDGLLSWWIRQFHASNVKVTIGEACDTVSQDVKKYKDPLFAKDEKGGLTSVSGVPFGKFQVRNNSGEIAFLEYQGKIYSVVSADLLNKPIGHDGFTIHIANIETIDKIQNPKLIKAIIEQYRQFQGNEKFKGFLAYQIALHFKGKQDNQEYFKWIQESADLGNVIACRELGNCFFSGTGIKQNYVGATKWYRKAAEQGDANAQCKLGECYYDGNGVPQNYGEAVA